MAEKVERVFASGWSVYTVGADGSSTVWGRASTAATGCTADPTAEPVTVTDVPEPQLVTGGFSGTFVVARG